MMNVIENAVVVGRSFGDNVVYTIMNDENGKTISMLANKNIEMLELGTEGMVQYEVSDAVRMMSFEFAMQEELA